MEKGATQQPIIIKKKKGHGHGHHGGSWKVALADFMTAMMAFFLLMWLLGSTSTEEQKAIAGYFQDPGSAYVVGEGGADLGLISQDQPLKQSQSEEPDNDMASDKGQQDIHPNHRVNIRDVRNIKVYRWENREHKPSPILVCSKC